MNKKWQTQFSTRQTMLSTDFELYYYNDSRLEKVETHTHDYYEIYLFLEGEVTMEIKDEKLNLKSGDVIVIPPKTVHCAKIKANSIPYRRFVFWLSKGYIEQLSMTDTAYDYLTKRCKTDKKNVFHTDLFTCSTLQSRFFRLIEETKSHHFGKEEKIKLMIRELILELSRLAYEADHPQNPHEKQSLYSELIAYIENNPDEDLSLQQLSRHFYVSKYHIAHLFKDGMGLSIHQYITKKRLESCRNALLPDTLITSVYPMYGFKDYSSFYRAFKKEYGLSPSEYQKKHTK